MKHEQKPCNGLFSADEARHAWRDVIQETVFSIIDRIFASWRPQLQWVQTKKLCRVFSFRLLSSQFQSWRLKWMDPSQWLSGSLHITVGLRSQNVPFPRATAKTQQTEILRTKFQFGPMVLHSAKKAPLTWIRVKRQIPYAWSSRHEAVYYPETPTLTPSLLYKESH